MALDLLRLKGGAKKEKAPDEFEVSFFVFLSFMSIHNMAHIGHHFAILGA